MSAGERREVGEGDRRVARPLRNRETPLDRSGRPGWLKVRVRATPELDAVKRTVRERGLNTVCFSAACPNLNECWSRGTAKSCRNQSGCAIMDTQCCRTFAARFSSDDRLWVSRE
jgi:lipoate synthase